jgi:hypothetical protein
MMMRMTRYAAVVIVALLVTFIAAGGVEDIKIFGRGSGGGLGGSVDMPTKLLLKWQQHALAMQLDVEYANFIHCVQQRHDRVNHVVDSNEETDALPCDRLDVYSKNITLLCAKLANEYMSINLAHQAHQILKQYDGLLTTAIRDNKPEGALDTSTSHELELLKLNVVHTLAVLAFAQGDLAEVSGKFTYIDKFLISYFHFHHFQAERQWLFLSMHTLASKRSHAAQVLIGGSEKLAIELIHNYTQQLGQQFMRVLDVNGALTRRRLAPQSLHNVTVAHTFDIVRSPSTEECEERLLNFLLSEAQGTVRVLPRLSDLELTVHDIRPFDARQR